MKRDVYITELLTGQHLRLAVEDTILASFDGGYSDTHYHVQLRKSTTGRYVLVGSGGANSPCGVLRQPNAIGPGQRTIEIDTATAERLLAERHGNTHDTIMAAYRAIGDARDQWHREQEARKQDAAFKRAQERGEY